MRERSPGVWQLRVYVRDPLTGKGRHVSRTFRGGKRAAAKALSNLETAVVSGETGVAAGTVSQLLDAWLKDGTPDITPVTRATYERTVALLKPVVGQVKLAKLGPRDIEVAYQRMKADGISPHVLRQCHVSLRSALSTAQRWEWLDRNPAAAVKAPKVPKAVIPSAPSVVEVRDLIDELEVSDPDLAAMVTVAALTGLRRGELCGLRWSDLEGDTLHIRRAIVSARGKAVESRPKMDGVAEVPLVAPVAEVLRRIKAAQLERARTAGAGPLGDGWVLSKDGLGLEPRNPNAITRQLERTGKRLGVRISPHALRHFAGTRLLAEGVDIRSAASQLRHDPRVLLEHYAGQDPAKRLEAAEILGRALSP